MIRADVGVALDAAAGYPAAPFDPPERYPEFSGSPLGDTRFDRGNRVFALVREALFRHLGGYNPETNEIQLSVLQELGTPKKIVVKPNWVRQQGPAYQAVTTHASVLRPILDYLFLAFGPATEIVVADIPLQSADLHQIWAETGVTELDAYYRSRGLPVSFLDLRRERAVMDSAGFIVKREPLEGDPLGYVEVALGGASHLEAISGAKTVFSVNDYEPGSATCYHEAGRHSYLISKTVLSADLFVNVPKLKTHCKAGMTGCMKNLIGINGDKGWIPHFRMGAPHDGGDEHPNRGRLMMNLKSRIRNSLQGRNRRAFRAAQSLWKTWKRQWETVSGDRLTSGGAWFGNDTLWRSVLDLVDVVTFAATSGRMMERPQRRHLCLVDGIVAGEGNGPLRPTPRRLGVILCSSNPLAADLAACHLAGFDWRKIPQLYEATADNPERLGVSWNGSAGHCRLSDLPRLSLTPPPGWAGQLESRSAEAPAPERRAVLDQPAPPAPY